MIYIDPFRLLETVPKGDIVICTHSHFDHASPEDLPLVSGSETVIIAPSEAKGNIEKVPEYKEYISLNPGDKTQVGKITIHAIPAYNINKFRSPGQPFHPKEANMIGVILEIAGTRIYHTGDSDFIPEMKDIDVDVAMIPVSGTYVMTPEEAIEAVNTINPKVAIPMHYGAIVGSTEFAEKFRDGASCKVEILEKTT